MLSKEDILLEEITFLSHKYQKIFKKQKQMGKSSSEKFTLTFSLGIAFKNVCKQI